MAYTASLNNVYNHYMTTYAPKTVGRYDTHKKSELRNVYNSIVKMNQESPLSIIDTSSETQQFAVSMKENARGLHNTIASLGSLDEETLLSRKTAYSTNANIAEAKYIGDGTASNANASFDLSVSQMATPQVNAGKFLPANEMRLEPDTYSFDVSISGMSYEFQFNIKDSDTNEEIQNKLSKLINNANIGIRSEVISNEDGSTALSLSSVATGTGVNGNLTFEVSDDKTSRRTGAIKYFGLNHVQSEPQNALFTLNGEEHSAYSNTFTVEKTFEIKINGISEDDTDTATIGTKTDVESLKENVTELIMSYNDFIRSASEYLDSQPKSGVLLNEMNRISSHYQNELDAVGLTVETDGSITIDDQLLSDSAMDEDAREVFSSVRKFTNSLLNKTDQINLNPMDYVQKTIVAYKNPGKNFSNPYITSQYSGMMFNGYC